MTSTGLPEDVRSFLESSVDSLEQLSVLLLLFAFPDRSWTAAEITRELRSNEQSIEDRLAGLYRRNVLRRIPELEGRHRFNPALEEL